MPGGVHAEGGQYTSWEATVLWAVLRAHRRRTLTELCSCSTPTEPVRYSEEHVVRQAVDAGVIPPRQTPAA